MVCERNLDDKRQQEETKMENENYEDKRAPRDARDNNTVFIGQKPFMKLA